MGLPLWEDMEMMGISHRGNSMQFLRMGGEMKRVFYILGCIRQLQLCYLTKSNVPNPPPSVTLKMPRLPVLPSFSTKYLERFLSADEAFPP